VLPVRRFFVLPGAIGVTPGCSHSTRGIKRDTLNNFKKRALPAEVSCKQRACSRGRCSPPLLPSAWEAAALPCGDRSSSR